MSRATATWAILALALTSPAHSADRPSDTPAPMSLDAGASATLEAHIAQVKRQLGITQAEASQWAKFVAMEHENAMAKAAVEHAYAAEVSPSAVDTLRYYGKSVQAHADGLARMVPIFEALYALMPPDQRTRADAVMRQTVITPPAPEK